VEAGTKASSEEPRVYSTGESAIDALFEGPAARALDRPQPMMTPSGNNPSRARKRNLPGGYGRPGTRFGGGDAGPSRDKRIVADSFSVCRERLLYLVRSIQAICPPTNDSCTWHHRSRTCHGTHVPRRVPRN